MEQPAGRKFDQGKPRWDLIPLEIVGLFVEVLTHGAEKYGEFNWQEVPDMDNRYFAACLRHLTAHQKGELYDDSGHLHLAHAGCNIIFLLWSLIKRRGLKGRI